MKEKMPSGKEKPLFMNDWLQTLGRRRSTASDAWYLKLAKELLILIEKNAWFKNHTFFPSQEVVLEITAYLHDAIAQSGGWKVFTDTCQRMYGHRLPFYTLNEDYLPDEINMEDIAYLLWTSCTTQKESEEMLTSPRDKEILALAKRVYDKLDAVFEDAPISELPSHEHWVPGMLGLVKASTPLPEITPNTILKKDVQRCLAFSSGYPLIFLSSYEALNDFLIHQLDWEPQPEGLLTELKEEKDFVIYANAKGMLVAPNVASCLKDEHNKNYSEQAAKEWGYQLFTTPGVCPFDLLKYAMQNGLLPDVQLPYENGKELLHQNWDFIARYYLEEYYEGD